jgi:hypothetical protein
MPPPTVANSTPAAVICSSVSRRIPGSSSAGFARHGRVSGSLAAVSRGCAAPGPDASPTTLRNDCDNPGTKLATDTPTANATTQRAPVFQRIAFALFKPGRLKVFRDGLEFAEDRTRRSAAPVGCLIEAVIEVIVDQRLFRFANGVLDRVELLSQIDARPTFLDHGNDPP